ncbi:hypothetical protein G6M50_06255 [Agrobacterium rhizogenes]|nr:hypothetical protein [Rhizobium rhizogenes]NTJ77405.1 hypothetical protein [Rhizobium rhizogenes]
MNTVEILKKARELLSDEKRWTKGFYAVDIDGYAAHVDGNEACQFCAIGAIARVSGMTGAEAEGSKSAEMLAKAAGIDRGCHVPSFNDDHTHAEILDLFDCAIARAESEAA